MNKRKWALVALSVSSLFVATACSKAPGPDDVLNQYLSDWSKQDYKSMYAMLSDTAKKQISQKDFASRYQTIMSGIDTKSILIKPLDSSTKKPSSDTQSLHYAVTWKTAMTAPFTEQYTAKLAKGSNGWRIDWQPNLIFPQLKKGWKVHAQTLHPTRGDILTADGKPLADNTTGEQIGFVPGKMKSNSAGQLAKILNLSTKGIQATLHQSWVKPNLFVPIQTLPKSQEQSLEKQLLAIPGVLITPSANPVRDYPLGVDAAHLVGYVGPITADELTAKLTKQGYTGTDTIGQQGLERALEPQLRGQIGGKIWLTDAAGQTQKVLANRQPVAGDTVKVTINSTVQSALVKALGNHVGSAVVLDPATGAVLGMASYPNYDPNELARGMSSQAWQALLKNPKAPLVNRALSAVPPGSSLKPLVAGIGLTDGKLHPNTTFATDPLKWQENASWGSYSVTREPHPSGTDDLLHALVWSDNVYFAQVGLAIGANDFVSGLSKFGFGKPLPFALSVNKAQVSNDGKIASDVQLADSAYGQGQVLVSPLQLASMYTAFVNDGTVLKPYLIDGVTNPSGNTIQSGKKTALASQVISSDAVKTVAADLRQVVANPQGTAHAISNLPGWVVSGKTGTAQKSRGGSDWGWFAAWANQPGHSQPKYLVVMALANTQNQGGSHQAVVQVRNLFAQLH